MKRKNLKNLAVVSATCVAISATATGCSLLQPKLSMLEVMQTGSSLTSGQATYTINLEDDETKANAVMDCQVSNKNFALNNVKLNYKNVESPIDGGDPVEDTLDITVSDAFRMVDGNYYLNTTSIINTLDNYIAEEVKKDGSEDEPTSISEMLKESGIDIDINSIGWVSIPSAEVSDDSIQKSQALSNDLIAAFERAIVTSQVEVVNSEKNSYKMTVKDPKQMAALTKAIIEEAKTNKDKYIQEYTDIVKSMDGNSLVDKYVNLVIDSIKAACDELGITYTDSDFEDLKKQALESIGESDKSYDDMINEMLAEVTSEYDSFISELESSVEEMENSNDKFVMTYETSLTGKEGEYIFNQKLAIETSAYVDDNNSIDSIPEESKGKLSFSTTITENSTAVAAPENSKTIPDLVTFLIKELKKTDLLDEDMLNSIKGISLKELLEGSMGMGGYSSSDDYGYSDYGSDDYSDYNSYDYNYDSNTSSDDYSNYDYNYSDDSNYSYDYSTDDNSGQTESSENYDYSLDLYSNESSNDSSNDQNTESDYDYNSESDYSTDSTNDTSSEDEGASLSFWD